MPTVTARFVKTGSLEIGYEESGPESGPPVLLLHGFPYGVRSYDTVRDPLATAGWRVIVPHLRGYGATRFLDRATPRSGQQAALGKDVLDLLDALKIDHAMLVGFDWGNRAACVAAALWPSRVNGLVAMNGYDVQNTEEDAITPASAEQEERYWYQWYFQTERGRAGLQQDRELLARRLWQAWSPTWRWEEKAFAATIPSFDNPDFVEVVIHSYRHRYQNALGDPALDGLERQLAKQPVICVPTIALQGINDGVQPPKLSEGKEKQFSARYERRVLRSVGHCPPIEAPLEVVEAIRCLAQ